MAVIGLLRAAGDIEDGAGTGIHLVNRGAEGVIDPQTAVGGGDKTAFGALHGAAGNGHALFAVQPQGAVGRHLRSVADFATVAVVLVVAAADTAP
ncbi:hypothetical protein D3C80_930100 [compost metagenome]